MYEKTLERFQQVCEDNRSSYLNYYRLIDEADEKAIEEALKKQIPQNPKVWRYSDFKGYKIGDCPVCRRTVDSNDIYCFYCGQRIDWEVEK